MAKSKRIIVRVDKPTVKHGLYRVWFSQDGHEYPADMNEFSYKVLMLEQELLKAGVDPVKLNQFRNAVVAERDDEHKYDND